MGRESEAETVSGNDLRFWKHPFSLPRTRSRAPQPEQALAQALGESC